MLKSGKEFNFSHLKSLKEKNSGYGIDPFTLGYPSNLSRGERRKTEKFIKMFTMTCAKLTF